MKSLGKIIGIVIIVLILFLPTFSKLRDLEAKKDNLSRQIIIYQAKNSSLEQEIKRIKNDPAYLEAIAREKLKVAKEGEVVYKIEETEQDKR